MISEDIHHTFIVLINQLEEILPVLNQQGSQLVKEQRYQEARELISKAEKILSINQQVKALQEVWRNLDVLAFESSLSPGQDSPKDMQTLEKQFRSEPHLGYKAFIMPILQALVNLGGCVKRKFVFEELEKLMFDQLTESDWQTLPSDDKRIRWQKTATYTRSYLLEQGLITVDVKKGMWAITPEGRKVLELSGKGD